MTSHRARTWSCASRARSGCRRRYADQYKGERIRAYVVNACRSLWPAFQVIGSVFDRAEIEVAGHDSQTINLAPAQGGCWWTSGFPD